MYAFQKIPPDVKLATSIVYNFIENTISVFSKYHYRHSISLAQKRQAMNRQCQHKSPFRQTARAFIIPNHQLPIFGITENHLTNTITDAEIAIKIKGFS